MKQFFKSVMRSAPLLGGAFSKFPAQGDSECNPTKVWKPASYKVDLSKVKNYSIPKYPDISVDVDFKFPKQESRGRTPGSFSRVDNQLKPEKESHSQQLVNFLDEMLRINRTIEGCEYLGLDGRKVMGEIKYSINGDEECVETFGTRDVRRPKLAVDKNTLFDIASITKQYTCATLLKLWDNEISKAGNENFPNGIDTKIDHFLPKLRSKFTECGKFFGEIEDVDQDKKATLRDLLNHTHGLGQYDENALAKSNKWPMELSELINSSTGIKPEEYGKDAYGGVGIDFAAMIIEVITGKEVDEAVKETILEPYGLLETFTQSGFKSDLEGNHVRKCLIGGVSNREEPHSKGMPMGVLEILEGGKGIDLEVMDWKTTTRAASGFMVSMSDLAKFAKLFMGVEMFDNKDVKDAVTEIHKELPAHFCIKQGEKNRYCFGDNFTFSEAQLYYDVETKEVRANAKVRENITNSCAAYVFIKTFPDECSDLKDFIKEAYGKFKGKDNEAKLEELDILSKEKPRAFDSLNKLKDIEYVISKYLKDNSTEKKPADITISALANMCRPSPSPEDSVVQKKNAQDSCCTVS